MKKLGTAIVVGAAMLAVASSISAASSAKSTDMGQKNIVQTAVAAGQFKTLVALVKRAGLVGALSGPGPLTVFAPTDAAFAKLPAGTLDSLLMPENKAKLTAILTYHVVPGRVLAAQLTGMSSAPTANGQALTIQSEKGTTTVGGARPAMTDILCSNGVIHAIDTVLIPN